MRHSSARAGEGSRREASAPDRRAALRPRAGVHALDAEARAVLGEALLQAVVCGVVEALVAEGREPEVFRSANEDGGDEANEAFLRKYRASIPML